MRTQHAKKRRVRAGWLVATLAALIGTTVVPVAAAAPAAAVTEPRCGDIAELGDGFEELYRLSLPKAATWSASNPVPYTQHAPHTVRSLDRVAYCLETVSANGTTKRAYSSFDAFSSDTRDYDVPVRSEIISQPVDNLTVIGDGVAPVTNGDGGAIEFWPYTYSPTSPSGLSSGSFDYSDTPTTAGVYGSFQIHNARAKETVMAVNDWARSTWLDVGIGNQPSGHPDWTLSGSAQTMQSATLTAYVKPAEEDRTALSASDGCEAGVGELADYRLLYDIDVPATSAPWRDANGVDYAVDNSAEIDTPISRVAYCLETQNQTGRQWSYASMNTWTQDLDVFAVPETTGSASGRSVSGLTVRGSTTNGTSTVKPVDGGAGYLEIWRGQYSPSAAPGSPAGSANDKFDFADTPTGDGYGSFQVHDATNKRTVLALNGWSYGANTALDVGIGQRATDHPDWTFANNRAQFSAVRLAVYVRPAGVDVTTAPTSHQLYPRDLATDAAVVPVTGTVTDAGITSTELVVRKGDTVVDTQVSTATAFSYTTSIPAEFAGYDVELWAVRAGGQRTLIRSATDVVAGDTYIVQGQSNAAAAIHGNGPEYGSVYDRSSWVRTYGSPIADPALSSADRTWHRTFGDAGDWQQAGYIGRLGTSLGRSLADAAGVPVAIMMGGHPGTPSSFFQRNDAQPTTATTNYGRLLGRLEGSGVKDSIRAVIWYQGESDNSVPSTYKTNVEALLADWGSDLPELQQTYVVQLRAGCGTDNATGVQEVQRQFDARRDVTVMTTSGLDNHDGCHYGYEKGYRQLGQWLAKPIAQDTAGILATGPVLPPAPASFSWANPGRTSIAITLADPTQTLACDPGVTADFRLGGTSATVTGVTCGPGVITLSLNAAAPAATTISYLGHAGAVGSSSTTITDTAWMTDSTGMGLLAFGPQSIPPAAAVVPRCGDVAELGSGFEELYRLTLPKSAAWSTTPVPYTQHAPHSTRPLDRVAYCLETVDSIGTIKRAYASFDAFSPDTRDYDIPVRPLVIAQPVDNLTVIGDGVTPVTNATGGAIEFWPYEYSAASPGGISTGGWDYSDTPQPSGVFGSFQIHNVDAGETVMALNGWARSGFWMDVGIGNRPQSPHTDWTLSGSGQTMQSVVLTAYIKPAD